MIRFAKPATGPKGSKAKSVRTWSHRIVMSAGAALVALGTLAAPASAKPFQQYLNGACGATICTINFTKVPAGQRLVVSNVSCYVRLKDEAGRAAIHAAQFLVQGANPNNIVSAVTIAPTYVGHPGTEVVYSANHQVSTFANAQQRFQAYVEIRDASFSQVACHISGDLGKAT